MSDAEDAWDLEAAWTRLGTHLEWADAFWLVYVFTNDPRVVETLCERTSVQLESRASLRVWRCTTPGEVDAMVDSILVDPPVDVHWVDLVRLDDREGRPGWGRAWARMLNRLNMRRELLRQRAPRGGIVFATTLDRLEASPGLAPDLWTIRSLVLRIASLPRTLGTEHDVEFARQAVRAARARDDERGLAQALSALANVVVEEDAVGLRREAVGLWRRSVAREGSLDTQRELGAELRRLRAVLQRVGHAEQAFECACESVVLARALADQQRLNDRGRHEESLRLSEEAVSVFRELVKRRPDAFLPDLATAIHNLGCDLSNQGRHEAALRAAEEAVTIRRELVKRRPDAFLPDLASSLSNFGGDCSDQGRHEEALRATEEAVAIRRELVKTRPDAFLPDLARSLNMHGQVLWEQGEYARASDAFAEGLRILMPLLEAQGHAFDRFVESLARNLDQTSQTLDRPLPDDLTPFVERLLTKENHS